MVWRSRVRRLLDRLVAHDKPGVATPSVAEPFFEPLEQRRLLTAASVTLFAPPATDDPTPELSVVLKNPAGVDASGNLLIDVDLNDDGDFEDAGEAAYQSVPISTLTPVAPLEWQTKMLASDVLHGAAQSSFGSSIAVDGTRAVVGARQDTRTMTSQGAAYVFEFDGTRWREVAKLVGPDSDGSAQFGWSVAISGERIVIGAPFAGSGSQTGAAYVFERVDGEWVRVKQLLPGTKTGRFGTTVAVDGQTVVVGEPLSTTGTTSSIGRAHVFDRAGGAWTRTTLTNNVAGPSGEHFGSIVAMDSGRVAIRGNTSSSQRVYTVERVGGAWTITGFLTAPAGLSLVSFGTHLSMDGDRLMVGGTLNSSVLIRTPLAVMYRRVGGSWQQEATLAAPYDSNSSTSGMSVSGNRAAISAERRVDTFEFVGGQWVWSGDVPDTNSSPTVDLPGDVAMAGGHLIAGGGGSGNGSIFTYRFDDLSPTRGMSARTALSQALPEGDVSVRARMVDGTGAETVSDVLPLRVDLAPPVLVEALPASGTVITTSRFDLRVTFSEPVDVNVSPSLVLGGPAAGGEPNYTSRTVIDEKTWVYTISNLKDGVLTAWLPRDEGDIFDAFNRPLDPLIFQFTVAIVGPPTLLTIGTGATVTSTNTSLTATFSRYVTGVDPSDLILSGAAAAAGAIVTAATRVGVNRPDGAYEEWRFDIQNLRTGQLDLMLAPDADDIQTLDGLDLAPTAVTLAVDLTPRVAISPTSGTLTSLVRQFTFGVSTSINFDPTDVVVSGSAAANAVVAFQPDIPPFTHVMTISGLHDGELFITIAPDPGDVVNPFGEEMPPTTFSYDVVLPPYVVGTSPAAFTSTGTGWIHESIVNIDITLSESVDAVTSGDLTLFGLAAANATVGAPTYLGDNTWRFPVAGLASGNLVSLFAPRSPGPLDDSARRAPITTIRHVVELTPPVVTGVFLDSSTWSAAYRTHLEALGVGTGTLGYQVPGGAEQLQTLPWTGIDRLHLRFSESVVVQADALTLIGAGPVDLAALLAGGAFTYNATTFTATWVLTTPLAADKLRLALGNAITDVAGNGLDGEWSDGVSIQSGDGTDGGTFQFRVNLLPGDVNQSNTVLGDDVILVRNAQFQSPGDAGYNAMLDVDGSGSILGNDVIFVRNRQFTSLPTGEPTPPAGLLQLSVLSSVANVVTEPTAPAIATVSALPLETISFDALYRNLASSARVSHTPPSLRRLSEMPALGNAAITYAPVLQMIAAETNLGSPVRYITAVDRRY